MDFIKPSEEDPEKVILVLVVANAGETFLLLYRWDTKLPLHRLKPLRCSGQQLPIEDSLPLMLIPSTKPLSFLLVTETELVFYSKVTASRADRTSALFRMDKDNVGRSQPLLWTQWAKPKRHLQYTQGNDDLFLMREDGRVMIYLIESRQNLRVRTEFSPGGLGFRVDTAFCLLAGPLHLGGGDILIAAGDMADGAVFHLKARQPLELVQTLPAHTPVNDLLLRPPSSLEAASDPVGSSVDEVYAACGRTPSHGFVAQLRFGYEAQIGLTMEHGDSASIQQIWVIESHSDGSLLLLASHVLHTSAIVFSLERMEVEHADSSSWPGLDLEAPSLAVGCIHPSTLIQVTSRSIHLVSMRTKGSIYKYDFAPATALSSDVMLNGEVIATAARNGTAYGIFVHKIESTANNDLNLIQASHVSLPARSVCLRTAEFHGVHLVLISMENGLLGVYMLRDDLSIVSLMELQLSDINLALRNTVATSLAWLFKPGTHIGVLLCGLRSGQLVSIHLTPSADAAEPKLTYSNCEIFMLGTTSVTLSQDWFAAAKGTGAAFASCESSIKHVRLLQHGSLVDHELTDVIVTSRDDLSLAPPTCTAVHRIFTSKSGQNNAASGLLILATSEDLLFTNMVPQKQAVARRFVVPGVPKRLIWSKYLKQLVIAAESDELKSQAAGSGVETKSSALFPALHFREIRRDHIQKPTTEQRIVVGESGERIRALVEYSPTDGSNHFEMILVAVAMDSRDEFGAQRTTGRLMCVSAKYLLKDNGSRAKARVVLRFPTKAVTALRPIGHSSVLVGAGNEILMHDLNVSTRKWTTLARFTLPSPAASIMIQGSLAYVATMRHSLLVLRALNGVMKLESSDQIARVSTNVVPFDRSKALLLSISDSGTLLSGFDEDRRTNSICEVFQGRIPLLLDRIVKQEDHKVGASDRHSFIAGTIDGTLYQLKTLSKDELKLARFLEELHTHGNEPRTNQKTSRSKMIRNGGSLPSSKTLKATYSDGDILASMLEPGTNSLANLLSSKVKIENEVEGFGDVEVNKSRLRELMKPVMGEQEDILGAVLLWLRQLLR